MDKKFIDLISNLHKNLATNEDNAHFVVATLLTSLFVYRHPDLWSKLKNPVNNVVFKIENFGVQSRLYNLSYTLEMAIDEKNKGVSEIEFASNIVDQLAEELRVIMEDFDVYPYLLFMPYTGVKDSSYSPLMMFKIRSIFVPKENKNV